MSETKTSLSFTDADLVALAGALAGERETLGDSWDNAREFNPDDADYWRQRFEHVDRLHRRTLTARRRLARKAGQ